MTSKSKCVFRQTPQQTRRGERSPQQDCQQSVFTETFLERCYQGSIRFIDRSYAITEKNLFAIVVEVVAIIERLYPNGLPQKLVGPIATLKAAIEANRKMRVNKFKGVKSPGRPSKVEKRRQIARLLAQGLTRKQIMEALECGSSIIDSVKKEAAVHNDEVVLECLNDVEERVRRAE